MTRSPRSELLGLLQAARQSPDDLSPRLVVADWLEEHGDESDRDRAEYIRLCCVPSERRNQASYDRAHELWQKHREAWLGPFQALSRWGCGCVDGFPSLRIRGRDLIGPKVAALRDSEDWAWVGQLHVVVE